MGTIGFHAPKGLITNASPVLSPGQLVQAWNALIRRRGFVEQRRPYRQVSYSATIPNTITIAGAFQKSATELYLQTTDGKLYYLSDTNAITLVDSSAYGLPLDTITKSGAGTGNKTYARSATLNGNCYFATQTAVYTAEKNVLPRMAGVPAAPDIVAISNPAGGKMVNNTGVAYRVVWGLRDSAGNVIQGPPSGRAVFYNTSGVTSDCTLTIQLPAAIAADIAATGRTYNYYVYCTSVSAAAASLAAIPDPGDSMNLVYQGTVNTAQTNNVFTITDSTPDGFTKGPELYTNSGQGGLRVANYMPPCPFDIAAYRGVMYYAGNSHFYTNQLTSIGVPDSWSITGCTAVSGTVTLTVSGAPDLTTQGIQAWQKVSVTGNSGTNINGDFTITSVGTNTIQYTSGGSVAGTGGTAMVGGLLIANTIQCVASYTQESSFSGSNPISFAVTTNGSTAQNIVLTKQSLVRALNKNTQFNGKWIARAGDTSSDAPGLIRFESTSTAAANGAGTRTNYPVAAQNIYFRGYGAAYGQKKWYPDISGAPANDPQTYPGRLFFSKTYQPESVPLLNYFDIGDASRPIRRLVANRDSLFIFKDDGVFRLYGDPNTGAVPTRFDDNLQLLGDNMLAVMHNDVYLVTTRGICALNDSGVRWISDPIQDKIRLLADWAASSGTSSVGIYGQHCIANERDGCVFFYMQFLPTLVDKTTKVFSMCYNAETDSWTQTDPTGPHQYPGFYSRYGFGPGGGTKGLGPANAIYRHYWHLSTAGSGQDIISENNVFLADDPALNTVALGVPLPGDAYHMSVASASGGTVTLNSLNGWGKTAAVGDVLYQQISGVNYAWKVTAIGPVTITPLGNAPTNMSAAGSIDGIAGACYLLKPFTVTLEWTQFVATQGKPPYAIPAVFAFKHWGSVTPLLDGNTTADSFTIGTYSELVTSAVTQSVASRQLTARVFVPLLMQRSRKLSVIVEHAQAGKFFVVDGIAYEFTVHETTRENE